MPIRFACPHCTARVRVPDAAAGARAKCPQCGQMLTVPQASEPEPKPNPQAVVASSKAVAVNQTTPETTVTSPTDTTNTDAKGSSSSEQPKPAEVGSQAKAPNPTQVKTTPAKVVANPSQGTQASSASAVPAQAGEAKPKTAAKTAAKTKRKSKRKASGKRAAAQAKADSTNAPANAPAKPSGAGVESVSKQANAKQTNAKQTNAKQAEPVVSAAESSVTQSKSPNPSAPAQAKPLAQAEPKTQSKATAKTDAKTETKTDAKTKPTPERWPIDGDADDSMTGLAVSPAPGSDPTNTPPGSGAEADTPVGGQAAPPVSGSPEPQTAKPNKPKPKKSGPAKPAASKGHASKPQGKSSSGHGRISDPNDRPSFFLNDSTAPSTKPSKPAKDLAKPELADSKPVEAPLPSDEMSESTASSPEEPQGPGLFDPPESLSLEEKTKSSQKPKTPAVDGDAEKPKADGLIDPADVKAKPMEMISEKAKASAKAQESAKAKGHEETGDKTKSEPSKSAEPAKAKKPRSGNIPPAKSSPMTLRLREGLPEKPVRRLPGSSTKPGVLAEPKTLDSNADQSPAAPTDVSSSKPSPSPSSKAGAWHPRAHRPVARFYPGMSGKPTPPGATAVVAPVSSPDASVTPVEVPAESSPTKPALSAEQTPWQPATRTTPAVETAVEPKPSPAQEPIAAAPLRIDLIRKLTMVGRVLNGSVFATTLAATYQALHAIDTGQGWPLAFTAMVMGLGVASAAWGVAELTAVLKDRLRNRG